MESVATCNTWSAKHLLLDETKIQRAFREFGVPKDVFAKIIQTYGKLVKGVKRGGAVSEDCLPGLYGLPDFGIIVSSEYDVNRYDKIEEFVLSDRYTN